MVRVCILNTMAAIGALAIRLQPQSGEVVMKAGCLFALVLTIACAGQDAPVTAADVRAAMEAEMRGQSDAWGSLRAHDGAIRSVLPPAPDRTSVSPEPVSVAALLHKIPKKAKRAFEEALKLSEAGDIEGAVSKLTDALRLDPDFAQAHNNLGAQYFRLDRLDEAAAAFERSLALDPVSAAVHANLAAVEVRRHNLRQAETSLRRALAISSTNPRARYLLGLVLSEWPETQAEAIQHLEAAAPRLPAAKEALTKLRAFLAR